MDRNLPITQSALLSPIYAEVPSEAFTVVDTVLSQARTVEELELGLAQFHQADIPVREFVENGVYVREILIPKGTFAVGMSHTAPFVQVVSKGRMLMFADVHKPVEVKAPYTGTGSAGYQKAGYALEDTVWTTFHNCGDTTDPTEAFQQTVVESKNLAKIIATVPDREDFKAMLAEGGFTSSEVREVSVDSTIYKAIKSDSTELRISPIQGLGLFTLVDVPKGQPIMPAAQDGARTQAGRYVNHSATPNCQYSIKQGVQTLISITEIAKDQELTVDYRLSPKHKERVWQE